MYDLERQIDFLEDEIRKCKLLQTAATGLSGNLSIISNKLNSCSDSMSSGGFTIDGVGADVYTFGGYKEYSTKNIIPSVNSLNSLCSSLSNTIIKYDKDLTDCINERNRLIKLQEQEEKKNEDKKPKPMTRFLSE